MSSKFMSIREIELSIVDPLEMGRSAWPVTMGVPFPTGVLSTDEALRLQRDGQQQSLQTRTMLKWPDGSVKWALIDFQADFGSAADQRLQLSWPESVEARPETDTPVSVRKTADGALFH